VLRKQSTAFYRELLIHVLFWLLFLSAVNVEWNSNWLDRSIRPETLPPLSILVFGLFFYLNAFYFIPRFLNHKKWYRYFLVAPLFFIGLEVLRIFVFFLLTSKAQAFTDFAWTEVWGRDSFLFANISPASTALFMSFAYRFSKDWFVNQRRIERLETDKIRNELQQLKAQINPHFLFNNLNTLDGLIEKNPALAQDYLHKMAGLYRYVLTNSEQELVPLEKELAFSEQYIFLLENRFGGAYQFERPPNVLQKSNWLIPPTSLQTLIENVVKHNEGTPDVPLITQIKIQDQFLEISHSKRPKTQVPSKLGTGLKNLQSRYQLICQQAIEVIDSPDHFTVRLPLIQQVL
jgi:hypothetical protein